MPTEQGTVAIFCAKTIDRRNPISIFDRSIRALRKLYPEIPEDEFEITIPHSKNGSREMLFAFVNISKKYCNSMIIENITDTVEGLKFIVHHKYNKSEHEPTTLCSAIPTTVVTIKSLSNLSKQSVVPIGSHLKSKCLLYNEMCFLPISKTRESIKWRANSCSPIDKHYL
jgi:hypothetical protein